MKLDKLSIKPKKVKEGLKYMKKVYDLHNEMHGGNIGDYDDDELPTTYPTKEDCCMSGTGFLIDDDDMLIDDGDETNEDIYTENNIIDTVPGLYDMRIPLNATRRLKHEDSDYYIKLPGETKRMYIKRIDEDDYEPIGVDNSQEHLDSRIDEEYKEVSEQLLEPTDSEQITIIKDNERLPNRGVAFELFTRNSDASQRLLKYITKTTDDFKDINENPSYYIDGDMSRPIQAVGRNAYGLALYDFWNGDSIVELKWYINSNVCSVQDGKFLGNGFSTPLFIQNTEGNLVLYNVWNTNIGGYVYPTNNKSLFIYARLDDGLYMLDMLSLINGTDAPIDVDIPIRTTLQKTPNGEQLYSMKAMSLDSYFTKRRFTINNNTTTWYDIKKSQMKKLN